MNELEKKITYNRLIKMNLQQLTNDQIKFLYEEGIKSLSKEESTIKKQGRYIDPSMLSRLGKRKIKELANIEREMEKRNLISVKI